jgi:hypothetical protein
LFKRRLRKYFERGKAIKESHETMAPREDPRKRIVKKVDPVPDDDAGLWPDEGSDEDPDYVPSEEDTSSSDDDDDDQSIDEIDTDA